MTNDETEAHWIGLQQRIDDLETRLVRENQQNRTDIRNAIHLINALIVRIDTLDTRSDDLGDAISKTNRVLAARVDTLKTKLFKEFPD